MMPATSSFHYVTTRKSSSMCQGKGPINVMLDNACVYASISRSVVIWNCIKMSMLFGLLIGVPVKTNMIALR